MDSKTQKELEANSISQEPKKGNIRIHLATLKNGKEVIPVPETKDFIPDLSPVVRFAGMLQMMFALVGMLLIYFGNPAFTWIPHWGQLTFHEHPYVQYAFFTEYCFGLALLAFSTEKRCSRGLFLLAVWIYAAFFLTVLSSIQFLLVLPPLPFETIQDLHPVLIHFISFGFHMLIIALAKDFYHQYKEKELQKQDDDDDCC